MPVTSAVRNVNGSVTAVLNGSSVTLTAADVAAITSAPSVARPLTIVTGSGRKYGHEGTPRYGVFFYNGEVWALDKFGSRIPGTNWKPRNMNRAKLTFAV